MVPPHLSIQKHRHMMIAASLAAFIALSCSFSVDLGGEPTADLAATQNVLLETQMALDATQQAAEANAGLPTEQLPQNETQQQAESPGGETSVEAAATATGTPIPDVEYQGIAFSFDSSIGGGLMPQTIPAQILGEDAFPGDNHPAYDEFDFYDYALSDTFHNPAIYVYPADEYAAIDPAAAETIARLQQILVQRPAERPQDGMPFLPHWNAAQFMAANIRYLDFQNGSGVRYLTMYGQAAWPVNNHDIFYTFQGLTADGAWYIAAVLPISNPVLPDEGVVDDFEEFGNNFENTLADTVNQLNAQPHDSFTPNLALLDAMMQSFRIR